MVLLYGLNVGVKCMRSSDEMKVRWEDFLGSAGSLSGR